MLKKYEIQPSKTYANEKNAEKAVAKMIEKNPWLENLPNKSHLIYSIVWNKEGRCFPVFHGMTAIQAGIPHLGFNVVAFS